MNISHKENLRHHSLGGMVKLFWLEVDLALGFFEAR